MRYLSSLVFVGLAFVLISAVNTTPILTPNSNPGLETSRDGRGIENVVGSIGSVAASFLIQKLVHGASRKMMQMWTNYNNPNSRDDLQSAGNSQSQGHRSPIPPLPGVTKQEFFYYPFSGRNSDSNSEPASSVWQPQAQVQQFRESRYSTQTQARPSSWTIGQGQGQDSNNGWKNVKSKAQAHIEKVSRPIPIQSQSGIFNSNGNKYGRPSTIRSQPLTVIDGPKEGERGARKLKQIEVQGVQLIVADKTPDFPKK